MKFNKLIPVGITAAVIMLVIGLGILQQPTNRAQAQEIVEDAIEKLAQLPYEEQLRLNTSLNVDLERLLNEAHQAPDLAYSKDEFGDTLTYTDSLSRQVRFLVDNDNIVKYVVFDGASNIVGDIKNWKTFHSPELGVSFQYPEKYKDLSFTINRGTTGKIANGFLSQTECVEPPCSRTGISFGANTSDYSAPRGASGIEGLGFTHKNGKYFSIWLDGKEYEITDPVREIKGKNTTGIIIQGKEGQIPGPGVLMSNERKIVFNLNSSEFKAITFLVNIDDIPESELETILKTIEVK